MSQTSMHDEADSLRKKIAASGRPSHIGMTQEQLDALYRRQMAGVAQREAEQFKPDWKRLGITEEESKLTWKAVKPGVSDGIKAVEAIKPMYEQKWGFAMIWGNWGQAKTLIGKILTATAFRDGKRAAYANMTGILNDIRLAFDKDEGKTTELLRRMDWWVERDVLFLDELDKANNTPWALEQIFVLLDKRYTLAVREQALTVIASNSIGELDGYIKSRLSDNRVGKVLHLNGKDGRVVVTKDWKF